LSKKGSSDLKCSFAFSTLTEVTNDVDFRKLQCSISHVHAWCEEILDVHGGFTSRNTTAERSIAAQWLSNHSIQTAALRSKISRTRTVLVEIKEKTHFLDFRILADGMKPSFMACETDI
jgi:hypothetical protein